MQKTSTRTTASVIHSKAPRMPPSRSFISLTHALTWIGFGVSLGRGEWLRDVEAIGEVEMEWVRRNLIRASERLLSAASKGAVHLVGQYFGSRRDSGEPPVRERIPGDAFLEFRRFDVFTDGLHRSTGLAWRPLRELLDTALMPAAGDEYRSIEVSRNGLVQNLRPARNWHKENEQEPSQSFQHPTTEEILAKADEMRASGLNGRQIASQMRYEPGYDGVKVTEVRGLIHDRYKQGPRPKE